MYNATNANVIEWRPEKSAFCRREIAYDSNGARCNFHTMPSPQIMNDEQRSWVVVIPGPRLLYSDNEYERNREVKLCIRETILLLVRLCSLVGTPAGEERKTPSIKSKNTDKKLKTTINPDSISVREIVFVRWDLLSPVLIMNTDLRPFRRVQFIECREFTMTNIRSILPDFRATNTNFDIICIPERSTLSYMKHVDPRAALLAALHGWKYCKLAQSSWAFNLLINEPFRAFVQKMTGSDADKWYAFVNRESDENIEEDRELYNKFNKKPLVKGSNAERFQECAMCGLSLPGLCYPIRRRNSEDAICHACEHDSTLFSFWPGNCIGSIFTENGQLTDARMQGCALLVLKIATPNVYPYVKAPLNTRFNAICPLSLKHKQCKHPDGKECTLLKAHVSSLCIRG